MLDLKYTEILRLNKSLGDTMDAKSVYQVTVLSNIITDQFNYIFEYALRSEGVNAKVNSGDYDNIVQDSLKYNTSDLVIIFWELANLVDGLQYKANVMTDEAIEALINKVCNEIDLVINNLQRSSLIIFNKFSGLIFNYENLRANNFDKICNALNQHLEKKATANIILVDINNVLAKLSIYKSVDLRYYYSSKALYTVDLYKAYALHISPVVRSVKGKAKKAIIFDCDNTLWKGILGEDGPDRIEMSGKTRSGVVFEEVQNIAIEFSKKGILIGLCSKNNPQDVEAVITGHPDMSIRNDHITIKKINWEDKAKNLRSIAAELNIGSDSIIFVDDSDFEVGYIRDELPEVKVLQVPKNLYEYPQLIRSVASDVFNVTLSDEDLKKTLMYKQQAERTQNQSVHQDIESYLRSLQLEVTIYINNKDLVPRISQLTQKTNQFNLTTKRYTEADIVGFMDNNHIFAFDVKDKYGDSGITGISMVQTDQAADTANIDSLLMSCRVIGRNVELAFFDALVKYLKDLKIKTLTSRYVKTYKNEQVSGFYDQLGFTTTNRSDNSTEYVLDLNTYKNKKIDYIKIHYGTKN